MTPIFLDPNDTGFSAEVWLTPEPIGRSETTFCYREEEKKVLEGSDYNHTMWNWLITLPFSLETLSKWRDWEVEREKKYDDMTNSPCLQHRVPLCNNNRQ